MSASMFTQIDGAIRSLGMESGPVVGVRNVTSATSDPVILGFKPSFVICYHDASSSSGRGIYILTENMAVNVSSCNNFGSGYITDTGFKPVSGASMSGRNLHYIAWR